MPHTPTILALQRMERAVAYQRGLRRDEVGAREILAALHPPLHSVRSLVREEGAGRGDLGGMVSAGRRDLDTVPHLDPHSLSGLT